MDAFVWSRLHRIIDIGRRFNGDDVGLNLCQHCSKVTGRVAILHVGDQVVCAYDHHFGFAAW